MSAASAPRAVIFGCAGHRLTPAERRLYHAAQPWGVILFSRNIENPAQLAALTAELRDATGRDLPILIDQEGGRVQRMGPPHWRAWPPALEQSLHTRDPERAMYLRGRLIAAELLRCGITVNCAPLADIATPSTHAVLQNRCYGMDAASVSTIARAMSNGLMHGGVLPVLKHIPGHGRATRDSHRELPHVTASRQTLESSDFAPFRGLADLPLAMTAHVVFSQIDPSAPATQSHRMIRVIRDDIGFEGLLMTDDISMEALSGTVARRAELALGAGCDVILHCNGVFEEMETLAEICPVLEGGAQKRSERALAARRDALFIDEATLLREYQALVDPGEAITD